MFDVLLFCALLFVWGCSSLPRLFHHASARNEVTVKTLLSTLLLGLLGVLYWQGMVPARLLGLVMVLATVGILAPSIIAVLARAGWYDRALALTNALYWQASGRAFAARLVVNWALQRGEGEAVREILRRYKVPDPFQALAARSFAAEGAWQGALAVTAELPETLPAQDTAAYFDAAGARVQALLQLQRLAEAQALATALKEQWQRGKKGPLGYRTVALAEARLKAQQGDLQGVLRVLEDPLPEASAVERFEILAEAAERQGNQEAARQFYQRAYLGAPKAQQPRLAARLAAYGVQVKEVVHARPWTTMVLGGCLLLLFGFQLWIDRWASANLQAGTHIWATAAGFLTLPEAAPGARAVWRYLSYAYVHGGFLHILLNVWVLWDIGRLYERRRHWGNLLAAFVLGTAMGAYLTLIVQHGQPPGIIGASGGILGIAGALLADVMRSPAQADRAMTRSLLQWLGIIVIFSVTIPNVSLWGHIGGLLGGMLWGFMRQGLPSTVSIDRLAGYVSLLLLCYALLSALWWLFNAQQIIGPVLG